MRSLLPLSMALAIGCSATTATDDDEGTPADSGQKADSGAPVDSGNPADSGNAVDSGNPPVDAGMEPDSGQMIGEDAGQPGPTVISGGDVSGAWCGLYEITGNITIAAGQTLSICGGSEIAFADGVAVQVEGTLTLSGETDSIRLYPLGTMWSGITVTGTLDAAGVDISGANNCIVGGASSSIDVNRAVLSCGTSLRLGNGGIFRYVTINGGNTVWITGGNFDIADSTLDLRHPQLAPDCTDWSGGSATIDHVRFTGCHCPLHWSSATGPIMVTNSIFDDAAVAVMIASANATFTHNHFLGSTSFLDIGGPFTADIAGNYYGGGAPTIFTENQGQFTGADNYSTTPFNDVGPR